MSPPPPPPCFSLLVEFESGSLPWEMSTGRNVIDKLENEYVHCPRSGNAEDEYEKVDWK